LEGKSEKPEIAAVFCLMLTPIMQIILVFFTGFRTEGNDKKIKPKVFVSHSYRTSRNVQKIKYKICIDKRGKEI